MPSTAPSITGAVSSISFSGLATEDISSNDVAAIEQQIAEIYGVDTSDLETNVDYVTSGILDVVIPDTIAETDAIAELQDSISNVLSVHPSDVIVMINDDGTVSYSVTGGSFEEATALQDALTEPTFVEELTSSLEENGSNISVESNNADGDVAVVVSATVDTSDASGTIDANEAIENMTEEFGFENSHVEGKFQPNSYK